MVLQNDGISIHPAHVRGGLLRMTSHLTNLSVYVRHTERKVRKPQKITLNYKKGTLRIVGYH